MLPSRISNIGTIFTPRPMRPFQLTSINDDDTEESDRSSRTDGTRTYDDSRDQSGISSETVSYTQE